MKNKELGLIIGGGLVVIGTNVATYALTSYFVGRGYKNSINTLSEDNKQKDKIIAEQKIDIESLAQNLTETQKALVDTVNGLTKRKKDYQEGILILGKNINADVNVREKLLNAYLKGGISDENSFRWMMNILPPYKPKPQTKQKIPSKKK